MSLQQEPITGLSETQCPLPPASTDSTEQSQSQLERSATSAESTSGGMAQQQNNPFNGAPLAPEHRVYIQSPTSAVSGTQQHSQPRRRYEDNGRIYKCGWNGCERSFGVLNHLNMHVEMQSHGNPRTQEEFEEARKKWEIREKELHAKWRAEAESRHQAASAAGASAERMYTREWTTSE